ncbi:hypothetical protein QE152_g26909 [Popillia japonica]|uniref:Uncharacterized protein n=1 Tax=Popillia japonica TaxID=7064 RepID=A0AAW1JX80_POPJA
MDRKTEFRKKDERTETEGDERAKDRDECERKQEEALIFARRSSLARTPPSTPTVPTVEEQIAPEAEMDDPWQDEKMDGSPIYQLTQEEDLAQSAKKRKRGLISPPKQKESRQETNRGDMMEVNSSLAKVVKRTRELKKLVNESTKTKVEIKHLARELAYLVDHLEKHVIQYQERHDCTVQRLPTETREVGIQTAAIGKSVAVQAETSDIEHEKLRAEEKMRTDIREALGSEGGFDGLASILDKKWPEDMYTRTREAPTSHKELNLEGDLALVLDPARATEDKAMENIMKMHPDLRAVVEKCDGQLDYMVKTIATRTRNLETTERTIAIYILPLKIDADGINDMEEAYDMVRRLRMSLKIDADGINDMEEAYDMELLCTKQEADLKRFRSFSAPSRKPPEKVDEGPRTPSGVDAEADKWQDECLGSSPIFDLTGDEGSCKEKQSMLRRTRSSPIFDLTGDEGSCKEKQIKDENCQTLKKRKRTTTPLLEKEVKLAPAENGSWDEVSKMISKVLKRTRELKKLVNESSKTKIEIKQVARELDCLVEILDKKASRYENSQIEIKQVARELDCLVEILDKKASRYENSLDFPVERISKPKLEKSTQTVSTGCSVGIQTEAKNIEMEKLRAEDRNRNEKHRCNYNKRAK